MTLFYQSVQSSYYQWGFSIQYKIGSSVLFLKGLILLNKYGVHFRQMYHPEGLGAVK
jgi:hypothetical protein